MSLCPGLPVLHTHWYLPSWRSNVTHVYFARVFSAMSRHYYTSVWGQVTSSMWHVDMFGVEFGPTVPGEEEQGAIFFKGGPPIDLPGCSGSRCLISSPTLCVPQVSLACTSLLLLLQHSSSPWVPRAQQPCMGPPIAPNVCLCPHSVSSWQHSYWELLNLGVKREQEGSERWLGWQRACLLSTSTCV